MLTALLAIACFAASWSTAASTGSTVVSATVPTATTLDMSTCTGPSLSFGALSTSTTVVTPTCHIGFGANTTSSLRLYQQDRSGDAMTQVRTTLDTRSGVPSYKSVSVVDANNVWLGGSRFKTGDPTPLMYTTDGGTTWNSVAACTEVGSTVLYVKAYSMSEVLITNGSWSCRTTNGGSSWTAASMGSSASKVYPVPGTNVVWATSSVSGRLLRSTDKGATWSNVTTPAGTSLANVVGWGTLNATAINTVTAGDQLSRTAYAYNTNDGGATWTTAAVDTIAVTTIPATTGSLGHIDRNSTTGRLVAVGSWSQGNQFKTYYSDDSGATWTYVNTHQFTDTLRYAGGSTWLGGNRMNTVYVSTNDGVTWGSVAMGGGGNAYFNAISQAGSDGAIVTVGDASTVIRSTTTGASWGIISPLFESFFAVVSLSATKLAIVADDGTAWTSSDQGVTLTPATGCGGSTFRDGVAVNATTAVVVGASGKICRTTDSGATWSTISSPTGSWLTEVTRIADTGELIAHSSTTASFISSTDGGLTWSLANLSIGGAASKFAASASGMVRVITIGSAGTMWVSTDGGVTWTARDDGIASSLQSVGVSPSGTRILTGHYPLAADGLNRVMTSLDNGATWSSANINAGAGDVNALVFASDTRVWGLAGNKSFLSSDSGVTFTTHATSAGSGTELEVLDANTIAVSGIGRLLGVSRPTVSVPDVVPGTGLTAAGGAFGACLLATSSASATWPMPGTCSGADPVPWRPAVQDVGTAGSEIATSSSAAAGVDLVFGTRVPNTQGSGAYAASLVFEVIAP